MPRFSPRIQTLPAAAGRNPLVPANAGAFPPAPGAAVDPITTGSTGGPGGTVSFTTSSQPTLQALRERLQGLQQAAPELPTMAGMQSPWQGAAYLANTLVNSLQQRAAATAEQRGQQEMMKAFGQIDPATGATGEQISQIAQFDPEFAIKLWEDRAKRLNQERWEPIPTPQGETGQWYKNSVTGEPKKVGGGGAGAGEWKPSDIGSLRDDYTKAAATYDQAAPSWQSMKEAATLALDPKNMDVKGKGAADYNMIVGFAKLLDPNSVVREGEVKSASLTGGTLDMLNGWLNTVKGEGMLSDEVRRAIMTQASSRMQAYYDQVKQKRDWLTGVATRHGVNPEDIVAPLGEFSAWGGGGGDGAGNAAAAPAPAGDPQYQAAKKHYLESGGTDAGWGQIDKAGTWKTFVPGGYKEAVK